MFSWKRRPSSSSSSSSVSSTSSPFPSSSSSPPSSSVSLYRLTGILLCSITIVSILSESNAFLSIEKYLLTSLPLSSSVSSLVRSQPSPSCTCDNTSSHYISVKPCSGLVNQQYTIAHGALLAAYLGVELYIEDTGTRSTFQDADYKDSRRLPASSFYSVPLTIPHNRILNNPDTIDKFKVNIVGELPSYLQKCTFPEDTFYRRKANLDSSLLYLYDTLDTHCGVRIDCSFWGIKIHNEEERQNLITVLRHLQPSLPIQRLVDYIIQVLDRTTSSSSLSTGSNPNLDRSNVPFLSTGKRSYAAIHLRLEPDMNQGKPLPVPQDSVRQQLQALNIPTGIAIYVASGIAEEIMDQLPEGYQWLNRYEILKTNPEMQRIADTLMAEQLALVDLIVCESALYFIGDVRSTFSVAAAVTHQMVNVGWYYGSLSMWAENAPLLGLP